MYGTYVEYPTGLSPDWITDFPAEVVERNAFRHHPFTSSHLRTFKAFLLASIPPQQLSYDDDRGWGPLCPSEDGDGGNEPKKTTRFFDRAGADVAVMLPVLERAGDRIARMPRVLHVYNIANPHNDYKVHLSEQWDVDQIVRARAPLKRLKGARLPPPSSLPPASSGAKSPAVLTASERRPSVAVLWPKEDALLPSATEVRLEYEARGVWVPDEALVEVFVDGFRVERSNAAVGALRLDTHTLSLRPGRHTIEVELVDAVGGELVLASATVSFTTL